MLGSEVESFGSSSNAKDVEEVMVFAYSKFGEHESHQTMHDCEKRKS